ncbi:hypothetical protein [Amycolatopsis sp. NPDC021455]|uniref:hypothetical protein n=1 Tax=Amycolatopsis sp. NPDC021455 TaxID=3154901 RepID=UPI0033D1D85D
MTAAYGQVTTGYWPAVVIGVALLLVLVVTTIVAVRRWHRAATSSAPAVPGDADVPRERCRVLIAEALIVRERVAGRIDAATYRTRMSDLVSRGRGGADHVER